MLVNCQIGESTDKTPISALRPIISSSVVIGSQARLRIWCRKTCRFESDLEDKCFLKKQKVNKIAYFNKQKVVKNAECIQQKSDKNAECIQQNADVMEW